MGLALLRKEGARLTANMAKRVSRIEAAGNTTAAAERFREIQALPPAKSRNEVLSRVSELRKLDASKGTRAATAQRQSQLEALREQRSATREALVRNPRALPEPQKVDDLYSSLKKSVQSQVRRVKADPRLRSTQATDLFDEWLKSQPKDMTRRQKAAQTRRLIDISEFQGINTRGARIQLQRGIDAFGEDFDSWSKEQQSAAWDGFRELAARSNATMGSNQVLADIRAANIDGTLAVSFYTRTISDGRGGSRKVLSAAVATNMTQARHQAVQAEYSSKRLEELVRMSAPRARLI